MRRRAGPLINFAAAELSALTKIQYSIFPPDPTSPNAAAIAVESHDGTHQPRRSVPPIMYDCAGTFPLPAHFRFAA
jgi:hypothetical protein